MPAHSYRACTVCLTLCLALLAAPVASAVEAMPSNPRAEMMVFDGLIVRPVGIGATLVGAAVWIVTLPFSLLGGNAGEAAKAMIAEPAAFTFVRPLGDL